MTSNKLLVLFAQAVSLLFSPFYLPTFAFLALLFFSYLRLMPWSFRLTVLLVVYLFTVVLPRLCILLYRKINGWTRHQMGLRERRFVPYIISILSYGLLLYMMDLYRMPRFTLGVIVCALSVQVVCAVTNIALKVSTHAAASGATIGLLLAFSLIFHFDPTLWLCLCTLLCGLVCTARLILRQHTLADLLAGTIIGILCGFFSITLT